MQMICPVLNKAVINFIRNKNVSKNNKKTPIPVSRKSETINIFQMIMSTN